MLCALKRQQAGCFSDDRRLKESEKCFFESDVKESNPNKSVSNYRQGKILVIYSMSFPSQENLLLCHGLENYMTFISQRINYEAVATTV